MKYVRTLNQVQYSETAVFGNRACDLARLMAERLPVPQSFVLTAEAWDAFIQKNNIQYKIDFILQQVDVKNERTLVNAYNSIRKLIIAMPIPDDVMMELRDAYESLGQGAALNEMMREDNAPFASIISSPTYPAEAESFEGIVQNVRGMEQVILALKEIYAMSYTPDSIIYRKSINQRSFKLALIVQSMPGARASATAYSTDPEQQDMIFVHGYQGYTDLREVVAKDFFHVKKEFLNVTASQIVEQSKIIVRHEDGHLYPEEFHEGRGQALNDKEVQEVSRLSKKSEKVLGGPTKCFFVLTDDKYYLLFANRYAVPKRPTPPEREPREPTIEAEAYAAAAVGAASVDEASSYTIEDNLGTAQEQTEATAVVEEPVEEVRKTESEDVQEPTVFDPVETEPEASQPTAYDAVDESHEDFEEPEDEPESPESYAAANIGAESVSEAAMDEYEELPVTEEESPVEEYEDEDSEETDDEEYEDESEDEDSEGDDSEEDDDESEEDDTDEEYEDEDIEDEDDDEEYEDDDSEEDEDDDSEEEDSDEESEDDDEEYEDDSDDVDEEDDSDEEDLEDDETEEDEDLEDEDSEDDDEEDEDSEEDSDDEEADEEDDSEEEDSDDEEYEDDDEEDDSEEDVDDEEYEDEDSEEDDESEDDDEDVDEEDDSEEDDDEESEDDDDSEDEDLEDEDSDEEVDDEAEDDDEEYEDDDSDEDESEDEDLEDEADEDDSELVVPLTPGIPQDPALVQAEEELARETEGDNSSETREKINEAFRDIYAGLKTRYEAAGEKAPDMISELIQVGTQKGVFNIEGLSDTLAIKKKARRKKALTQEEISLVLGIAEQLK